MPNPFSKSRKPNDPYAIYKGLGIEWHVLKTYKQTSSEAKDPYARWFVAAKSDATFGSFELGDTYALDVKGYGALVAATPEWIQAYRPGLITHGMDPQILTPTEYLNQKETA